MSSLILTLTCAPGGVPLEARRVETDHFSLGRDPGNDWILPDPACQVSRHHCRITRDGDEWLLADLSRNGTRLETGPGHAAERDNPGAHRLASGDLLRLGDYEIAVTVQEEESSFRIMPLPDFIEGLRQSFATRPGPAHPTQHTTPGAPEQRAPEQRAPQPRPTPRAPSDTQATRRAPNTPAAPSANTASDTEPKARSLGRSTAESDPLLELLGLEGTTLPPTRRSVILYRLAASLEATVGGLRRALKTNRPPEMPNPSARESPFLGPHRSSAEMLRAIAGVSDVAHRAPERLIGEAFDDLQRHQLCTSLAYRRCMREMLAVLDPDGGETPATSEVGWWHNARRLTFLRRRHARLNTRFDEIVDASFARAYREEWEKLDTQDPGGLT